MYVGKRIKSVLSVLLIIGLLVVSVHSRAFAAGPLVMGPALKYAIGAGIVAGGLYAADKDDLNYVIDDYWTKISDHVKNQWQSAVIYGTGVGLLILNDPLNSSIEDYLNDTYGPGANIVYEPEVYEPVVNGELYSRLSTHEVVLEYDAPYYEIRVKGKYGGGWKLNSFTWQPSAVNFYNTVLANSYFMITDTTINFYYRTSSSGDFYKAPVGWDVSAYLDALGVIWTGSGLAVLAELIGDLAGFGNATEGRPDVKVPCPPVPASEWPDQWLDDLQDEMNRTGNPTLDDETSIEEWEDEYEWYLDEFGNIYKVKKGQQPKKPEDEPLRIPGPPFPAPDVPKNYPTEDDPDLTVEHHPPQTTVTENPDGSRTETTTQTTTTTKKWWDPSSQRWRTTTTDTTTTTTVDFAPDGTETGRTTTTTTQPKGEREETAQPDDTAIDWEPLRRGLFELTEKFPFCLPWDLMRGIQSLEASQWDRKIRIEVGDGIWPAMVIDLTMFDGIASITRVILLIVFDLGLIFGTRKLMGGDV
jgi:hypothetical protein